MKTYNTYKIGTAALAAVLVLGIGSCAHHKRKPAALPAPVSQPTAQATVLEAPKSLEGAWIKIKTRGSSSGSETLWWYIKNGESHFYWDATCSGAHPATPAYFKAPDFSMRLVPSCVDSLDRNYSMGKISYQPRGKTATLRIENYDRRETTLCRSASAPDSPGFNNPAVITFTSAAAGVYHGTVKGVFFPSGLPDDPGQKIDSISIYTE